MSGVPGADLLCFRQAQEAGLQGTFRAFLSSSNQNLASLVKRSDSTAHPILNLMGQYLFPNWRSLFSDSTPPMTPRLPLYSFNGRDVWTHPNWPYKAVWHGSSPIGVSGRGLQCGDWRQSDHVTGLATRLPGGRLLRDSTEERCQTPLIVLCVENSYPSPYTQ
ncbi:collagen alpha-1(XV) chain-like [Polyodon spathula]|uniref:collagen alpha-1(XV) chain-like n=1 Tax=Polyodon spathula TaxID=7913 RepID=UPI001B7E9206|nr:collagen alpha-1(XV) chain-like [Polyodon spathula]